MAPSASKSAKKRKHASFKNSTTEINVQVTPNDPSHDPIVVAFPRGVPTSILHRETSNDDTSILPHFTWSKLKPSSDRGRRITGSDDTCTYTAASTGRGHDRRLTKLYVAVLDKKTKTLKLIPTAERGTTFALEQTVKAYKPVVTSSALTGGTDQTAAKDRVTMLVESFGSKKKQKVMASRAANAVNINKVVGAGNAMMESVVGQRGVISEANREMLLDGSKVVNSVDESMSQARQQFLPSFDIHADTPGKVYNSQEMGGSGWGQVSRIVDKTIKGAQESGDRSEWIDKLLGKETHKFYVPKSISDLLATLDPFTKKGHVHRVKTAFLLYLMMRFHHKVGGKKKLFGDHNECISQTRAPPDVSSRLLELFMTPMEGEQSGYMMTPRQLDKLQCHMLILYVIASGSEMKVASVNQLLKDLNIDERRASLFYREAGFTVSKKNKGEMEVSLKVPLVFPPPKRGKK